MHRLKKTKQMAILCCPKIYWDLIFNDAFEQIWLWPYKAPGVVESGSYNITIVCGPRDMRLQKYVLISQK